MACSNAEVETDGNPQPVFLAQPAPPITTVSALPVGATLLVCLTQPVGLAGSKVGDRVYAMVLEPVVTTFSEVVIPQGATISGTILALPGATNAHTTMRFDQLTFGGRTRLFAAEVVHPQASWPVGSTMTLRTSRELTLR